MHSIMAHIAAKSYPLSHAAGMRHYGSLININPSTSFSHANKAFSSKKRKQLIAWVKKSIQSQKLLYIINKTYEGFNLSYIFGFYSHHYIHKYCVSVCSSVWYISPHFP